MIRRLASGFSKVKNFERLDLLNQYLALKKFPVNLVYFRAAWNPACTLTDQHIIKFSEEHDIEIIRIDSEVALKISQHYGVRSQPQFIFCRNGDEIVRQIGPNYEGLIQKYKKIMEIKGIELDSKQWVPYGSKFQKFYKQNIKYTYRK